MQNGKRNKNDMQDINTFLSYDEQIEYLKNKNLKIANINSLLEFLKTYGLQKLIYYYSVPFVKNNLICDSYENNVNSDMILNFFEFDRKIANLMFNYLNQIESKIATSIAYEILFLLDKLGIKRTNLFDKTIVSNPNKLDAENLKFLHKYFFNDSLNDEELEKRLLNITKSINLGEWKNIHLKKMKHYVKLWELPFDKLIIKFSFENLVYFLDILKPEIQNKIFFNFDKIKNLNLTNSTILIFILAMKSFKDRIVSNESIYDYGLNWREPFKRGNESESKTEDNQFLFLKDPEIIYGDLKYNSEIIGASKRAKKFINFITVLNYFSDRNIKKDVTHFISGFILECSKTWNINSINYIKNKLLY